MEASNPCVHRGPRPPLHSQMAHEAREARPSCMNACKIHSLLTVSGNRVVSQTTIQHQRVIRSIFDWPSGTAGLMKCQDFEVLCSHWKGPRPFCSATALFVSASTNESSAITRGCRGSYRNSAVSSLRPFSKISFFLLLSARVISEICESRDLRFLFFRQPPRGLNVRHEPWTLGTEQTHQNAGGEDYVMWDEDDKWMITKVYLHATHKQSSSLGNTSKLHPFSQLITFRIHNLLTRFSNTYSFNYQSSLIMYPW